MKKVKKEIKGKLSKAQLVKIKGGSGDKAEAQRWQIMSELQTK